MSKRLHIRPRAGLTVRDPEQGYRALPAAGAKVPDTRYWRRRLAAGDVEPVPAKRKAKAAKKDSED